MQARHPSATHAFFKCRSKVVRSSVRNYKFSLNVVPKNLQSENAMDFCDFPFALPFLAIGSAGEHQTPMSVALLRTAAWSCFVAP